jgi:hypothetical protein
MSAVISFLHKVLHETLKNWQLAKGIMIEMARHPQHDPRKYQLCFFMLQQHYISEFTGNITVCYVALSG